jgi:hypothetical protein
VRRAGLPRRPLARPPCGGSKARERPSLPDCRAAWLPDAHAWLSHGGHGRAAAELRLPRIVPAPRGAASIRAHIAQLSSTGAPASDADAGAVGAGPALAAARGDGAARGEGRGGEEDADERDGCPALSPEDARELAALRAAAVGVSGPRLGSVLAVLLAADAAALGLWQGGELVRHKVVAGYTVRRSQGGAQAAYEARGGRGGTAGSALRRRETRRLWQRVAERLGAWAGDVAECHALFQSGAVRNWGLLYSAT